MEPGNHGTMLPGNHGTMEPSSQNSISSPLRHLRNYSGDLCNPPQSWLLANLAKFAKNPFAKCAFFARNTPSITGGAKKGIPPSLPLMESVATKSYWQVHTECRYLGSEQQGALILILILLSTKSKYVFIKFSCFLQFEYFRTKCVKEGIGVWGNNFSFYVFLQKIAEIF